MKSYKACLYQITSSYFVAGLIVKDDKVIKSAPIIKWMIGRNLKYIETYCLSKHWKLTEIKGERNDF